MPRPSVTAPFIDGVNTLRFLQLFRVTGATTCQLFTRPQNAVEIDHAREIVEQAGYAFDSIHGRYGEEFDLSSPDKTVRATAVREFEHDGELAASLDGPMVVVHPSPRVDDSRWTAEAETRRKSFERSLEDLAGIGEEVGVVFLIENLPPGYGVGSSALEVGQAVRRVGSAGVRMCFDLGHANMTANQDGAVADQLAECLDVVSYLHIHDNEGREDDHRFPGDGSIDWTSVRSTLAAAPPDLIGMIELFCSEDVAARRLSEGALIVLSDLFRQPPSS
ncbi:MAG: sugar phosphate isomerase/epimerase family protein [Phycisphaerales bacterium]